MTGKAIILDANILIRAVLGTQARELIFKYAANVQFFAPDVAYADVRKYLPALLVKRGAAPDAAMAVLERMQAIVHTLDAELYVEKQDEACRRIADRDIDDWPILACALAVGCPDLVGRSGFLRYGRGGLDQQAGPPLF